MPDQYTKLRALLEKETYPQQFRLKLIGRNTPEFHAGVKLFAAHRSDLARESAKMSAQGNHVSMTYAFEAESPDSIVAAFRLAAAIQDIVMVI